MSFQGFIEIQCTRFNGKNLSRKLREGQQERLFRRWNNCGAVWEGEIASSLSALRIDLTTDTIYSDPANSLPDPHPVDQWGSAIAIPDLDPYLMSEWDRLAPLRGAS